MEKYRGIHPGLVIENQLRKLGVSKRQFAISVNEHPQTFNAIFKGIRKIPVELAFRIDRELKLETGTILLLQSYYEIAEFEKKQTNLLPEGFENIRKILFWDTDFASINWKKHARSVISRVFERGNDEEKKIITSYYGKKMVNQALAH